MLLRQLILITLCSLALVGCSKDKSNTPEAKSNEQAQKTIDCTVQYYINDSLLQYVHIYIVDSLHLEEGELPYSITSLDTVTSDFWTNTLCPFYRFDAELYTQLPVSSVKVVSLSRKLIPGSYRFCLCFTRNETQAHSMSIPMLLARKTTTSLKKWSYPIFLDTNKQLDLSKLMPYLEQAKQSLQTIILY